MSHPVEFGVPIPRLLPSRPLPPYAFVPGGPWPHPVSDPAGHSHGHRPAPVAPLDPEHWQECADYLHGIDLFHGGYYWEAHEAWEGLWHAAGRRGPTAALLQGLIRLAAAGVKVREGRPRGVVGHATAAAARFREVLAAAGSPYLGLDLAGLIHLAEAVVAQPPADSGGPEAVRVVLPSPLPLTVP